MSPTSSMADLFPVPSSPSSRLIPAIFPGVTPETTKTMRDVLSDNHQRWHIFFNDRNFHNHTSHRTLAIWAIGASSEVMKSAYKLDCEYQVPMMEPPEEITDANFKEHLGKSVYYRSYLNFFTDKIRQYGVTPVMEKYVFDKEYNYDKTQTEHPKMFDRFLGGVIHPMIHIGYGLEFCLPGMVAEGLGMAACHRRTAEALVPEAFFDCSLNYEELDTAATRLKSLVFSEDGTTSAMPAGSSGIHAFTILARALRNPKLGHMVDTEGAGLYTATMDKCGEDLINLVKDWHFDPTNGQEVEKKIEELSWMNAIIYGIAGWKKGHAFHADFFHMHMVTSSLFLPSYASYLSPPSKELLLRSYLLVSLVWWVSRGRPNIDIKGFYEFTTACPTPSGALPAPHISALPSPATQDTTTPNPWFPILESCIVHPDDHLPKLQRALAHYGSVYSMREAGKEDFKNTELPGAERLDGSLFIRVAGLTADKMGRVREGQEAAAWDRSLFHQN